MEKYIGLLLRCLSVFFLSSCGTTYFVDPVSTPVFTAAGQGYIQGSLATHTKLFLEGAYALPFNYTVVLTRENFAHGLDNDQSLTSFAFGHFWPNRDSTSSFQVLAGFGTGSHRIGPNAYYTPNPGSFAMAPRAFPSKSTDTTTSSSLEWLLTGNSDFRKYFIQAIEAFRESYGTLGVAVRLSYLDQYHYYLAS
ncbi:MAG TPA: hypothetical protein VG537_08970, partial [Candidatus Kapabacteria bacterium]|nr:hypothetical protein [Candidatus Kapabacteria bacterium]